MTIFEDDNTATMETDIPQGRTVNIVDRLTNGDEVYFVKNTKDFDPKLFANQVINLEKSSELNYKDDTYSMKLNNVRSSTVYVISSKKGCYEMMSVHPIGVITVTKVTEQVNNQRNLQGVLDDETHPLLDEVSLPSQCDIKLKESDIFNKKDGKLMERHRYLEKENDVVSLPETYYVLSDVEENGKTRNKQSEIIIVDSDTSLETNFKKERVKKKKKHFSEEHLPEFVTENLKTTQDLHVSETQAVLVTRKSKKFKRKEAYFNFDKTSEDSLSPAIIINEEKKPKKKSLESNSCLVSGSDEETRKQKKKRGKKHADALRLGTDSNQKQTSTIDDTSTKKKSRDKNSSRDRQRHKNEWKLNQNQITPTPKKPRSSDDEETNIRDQKTNREEPSKIKNLKSDKLTSDNILENNLEAKQENLEDVPPHLHKRKSHKVNILEGYYVSSDKEKKKKVKKKPASETTTLGCDSKEHRDVQKRLFFEENMLYPECKDELVDPEDLKMEEISTEDYCIPELQIVREKSRKLTRSDPQTKSYRPEIHCDLSDLLANGTPKKERSRKAKSGDSLTEHFDLEYETLVTEDRNTELTTIRDKKKKKKRNKSEKGISDFDDNYNLELTEKAANLEEADNNLSNTPAIKEHDELSQTSLKKSKKSNRKKGDCMVDKESDMLEVSLPEIECLLSHLFGDENKKKKKKKSERNHSENVSNCVDQNERECSELDFKIPKCNSEKEIFSEITVSDCSIDKRKTTKKRKKSEKNGANIELDEPKNLKKPPVPKDRNSSVATPTRKSKKSREVYCEDMASDIFEKSLPDIEGLLSDFFSEENKKTKKKRKLEINNSQSNSSFTENSKEQDKEQKKKKEDKREDINKFDSTIMDDCLNDSRKTNKRKLTKIDSATIGDNLNKSKKQKRKNDLNQLDSDISKVFDSICPDLSIDEDHVMSKKKKNSKIIEQNEDLFQKNTNNKIIN